MGARVPQLQLPFGGAVSVASCARGSLFDLHIAATCLSLSCDTLASEHNRGAQQNVYKQATKRDKISGKIADKNLQ